MIKPQAICHPDLPSYAEGLCQKCWKHTNYLKNRDKVIERSRKYRLEHPQVKEHKNLVARKWRRKVGYPAAVRCRNGITKEKYLQMVTEQQGVCKICGGPPTYGRHYLSVDHSHTSGKIRGLLCQNCNLGLGHFKEDPEIFVKAIDYLIEMENDQLI